MFASVILLPMRQNPLHNTMEDERGERKGEKEKCDLVSWASDKWRAAPCNWNTSNDCILAIRIRNEIKFNGVERDTLKKTEETAYKFPSYIFHYNEWNEANGIKCGWECEFVFSMYKDTISTMHSNFAENINECANALNLNKIETMEESKSANISWTMAFNENGWTGILKLRKAFFH